MALNPRLALHAILAGFRPVLELTSAEVLELTVDDVSLMFEVGITPAMLDTVVLLAADAPTGRWRLDPEDGSVTPCA